MAALRVKRANIMGYKTHADFRLEINMAKTPQKVLDFLDQIWKPALKRAKEERDTMQAMIDKEGGTSFTFKADVVKEDDCRRIAEKCVELYGRIDILVNNVGIGEGDRSLVKLSEDSWNEIFDVNLKGMFFTCKYVLPVMEKQESRGNF